MKRILIALALLLAVQAADAQVKSPEAAKKAVLAAEEAAQNPKKNTKVATWLKLASSYMDAYDAPVGNILVNSPRVQLQMMMGNEKPVSVEDVVVDGAPFKKEVYANKNLYFDGTDVLRIVEVTVPVFEDPLANALEAYAKAYEVDVKKSKEKDIMTGIQSIQQKYFIDGMNQYSLGDYKKAGELLGKAAKASETAPNSVVDTTSLYNAGYIYWASKDFETAKTYFERCLAENYYYDNGEVYAKLGDVYFNLGDKPKGVETLEAGFVKFPQSQSILIGLINYYIESGENTDRLFELIGEAKKNEPENVSLYYVEGNIHKQLGDYDKALAAYKECETVDPNYDFGYHGQGALLYDKAVMLSDKAQNEFDDAKYNALVKEYEQALLDAIEPFEKAFEVSQNDMVKLNAAEYLKNIYYRFSSVDDKYMQGYNKYNEYVKANAQ
ncbi:MAG: tetratricopeptide repeat protein [Bacteroidales bacterium]|nr:tetratricopeptide repeat protein [Bacteroidales bacterium]MBQ8855417.1 tetratricopeptide repeat protein [Bacteroidales bacterium]